MGKKAILGAKENINPFSRPRRHAEFASTKNLAGGSGRCLSIGGSPRRSESVALPSSRIGGSPRRILVTILDEFRWLSSTNLGGSPRRISVAMIDGVNRWLSPRRESAVVAEFNQKVDDITRHDHGSG
ncbi:hypothetical protein YC2023_083375 [Brassica napus]